MYRSFRVTKKNYYLATFLFRYMYIRYTFSSNHNVNKRFCGLGFVDDPGPLINTFL